MLGLRGHFWHSSPPCLGHFGHEGLDALHYFVCLFVLCNFPTAEAHSLVLAESEGSPASGTVDGCWVFEEFLGQCRHYDYRRFISLAGSEGCLVLFLR